MPALVLGKPSPKINPRQCVCCLVCFTVCQYLVAGTVSVVFSFPTLSVSPFYACFFGSTRQAEMRQVNSRCEDVERDHVELVGEARVRP